MVFINEWLPNPVGADAKGEFMELWNSGNAAVSLNGWALSADGKKKFKLSGSVRPDEYLVLRKSETKLSLENTDGTLFLYDPDGRLVDRSAFEGSAPEGESFNRSYNGIQQFVWGKPTPGAKNSAASGISISDVRYPIGATLNADHLSWFSILGLAVCAGVIFAAILWYAMRNDENVSQLFF